MPGSRVFLAVLLASCLWPWQAEAEQAQAPTVEVPACYRSTRDQAGHELVKTEQFIVPVGTAVVIQGLEFDAQCTLTAKHQLILTQVFNSLEEITENTVRDPDPARVAEYKKMKIEVRGYSGFKGLAQSEQAISRNCAETVLNFLTNLGTPAWRLEAIGLGYQSHRSPGRCAVDFTRIQ